MAAAEVTETAPPVAPADMVVLKASRLSLAPSCRVGYPSAVCSILSIYGHGAVGLPARDLAPRISGANRFATWPPLLLYPQQSLC